MKKKIKTSKIYFWQVFSILSFHRLENKTSDSAGKSFLFATTIFASNLSTLEKAEYFKVFNLFTIIFGISLLLFGIAYFLSLSTIKDSEKLSQYECGFEPFDEATRHPFDVHFYVVGILFLIFDVEIALLFPWVLGLKFSSWFGFFTMIIFLGILTIGFFYEWHRGALVWPHKQTKF
jgi:NADH-quinone oxidoreductase subunit A